MFLYFRFTHFFWSWFAVWYSLSPSFFPYLWPCGRPFLTDVEVRDGEEIQHGRDTLLVFCCIIFQEVPTRAADNANVPTRQACSALCFWLLIDYLAQFSVPSSFNCILWFSAERVECSMSLKITLKCLSLRVILDLLNVDVMWSFHHRVRHAWDVEVDVLLVGCKVELVRVRWCNVTMFERTNFLHCVCVCLRLISQVPLFHREHAWRECLQTSQVSPFYLKNQVLLANVYHRSLVNGTFFLFPQKHVLCPQFAPIDHRLDWVWIGLLWKAQHVVLLHKTVERVSRLAVVQLWNPTDHSL